MKKAGKAEVCVLTSGGIDSTACINFYLDRKYKVLPLFVRYGQAARAAELRSVYAVCKYFGLRPRIVNLSGFSKLGSGELCGRNLLLVSVALMVTQGSTNLISLGIHSGTRYYDCGPDFAQKSESMISSYTDGRARLGTPFLNWVKGDVLRYLAESDIPVKMTWSCEASNKKPCGKCLSCRDREAALAST
jgi:7-cyano-7-deazaguanine synthase